MNLPVFQGARSGKQVGAPLHAPSGPGHSNGNGNGPILIDREHRWESPPGR
jgi:hypothetical protein